MFTHRIRTLRSITRGSLLVLGFLLSQASAAATTPTSEAAARKCTWTVKGNVEVKHQLNDLKAKYGSTSKLEGILVEVSAKEKILGVWGTWNRWAEKRTNADGHFSVSEEKSCDSDRRFRVKVKFQSDDLEVRHETATSSTTKVKWYTILHDQDIERRSGTTDLGDLTFEAGGDEDLGDAEARDHADIWITYSDLTEKLASYGSAYAFKDQLIVKYPHNSWVAGDGAEASYANPATKIVYIFKSNDGTEDHLSPSSGVATLLHEAMHVWSYQHSSGELDLAVNLFASGSTHCFEPTHIAFQEGFAEFAAERLRKILYDIEMPLPFNRSALNHGLSCEGRTDQITSIGEMETHEYGWMSAFRTLVKNKLYNYTYEHASPSTNRDAASAQITEMSGVRILQTCTLPPNLNFQDVLTVFIASPADGYSTDLTKSQMTFEAFFERARAIHEMSSDDKEHFLELLDPRASSQPSDLFCEARTLDHQTKPVDTSILQRSRSLNN